MDAISDSPPAGSGARGVLYLFGCAAVPLLHIRSAVTLAQESGFDTCLILSSGGTRPVLVDPGRVVVAGSDPVLQGTQVYGLVRPWQLGP